MTKFTEVIRNLDYKSVGDLLISNYDNGEYNDKFIKEVLESQKWILGEFKNGNKLLTLTNALFGVIDKENNLISVFFLYDPSCNNHPYCEYLDVFILVGHEDVAIVYPSGETEEIDHR